MGLKTADAGLGQVGRLVVVLGFRGLLTTLATSAGGSAPASSEPLAHCMTRILTDVPAEEAHEEVKSQGGSFGPVTRMKVNRKTGRMVYCSGTSYCYWSNALQIVSPCRVKRDNDAQDENWFIYFTR